MFGNVIVAEDEVVYFAFSGEVFCKDIERFLFAFEAVFDLFCHSAFFRPAFTDAKCEIWVQEAEYILKYRIVKDPAHKFVPFVSGSEPVSVS